MRAIGDIKRSGAWAVPAESHFRTWFGNIKLDLRQAQVGAGDTHIHAYTLFGNVVLFVPERVEVEIQANSCGAPLCPRTNCYTRPDERHRWHDFGRDRGERPRSRGHGPAERR